jgi:hypothetical protein
MEGAGGRTSFALRGLSRSDPDHTAAMVLENILRARANKSALGLSIRHHPRILPGVVTVSGEGSIGFPFALFSDRITQSEFAKAKNEVTAEAAKRTLHDQWLDVDTYRTTVAGDALALQNVAIADVQRVADRLAKNPVAAVVIRSSPTPAQ